MTAMERQMSQPEASPAEAQSAPQAEVITKGQLASELHFDDPRGVVADEASPELIAQANAVLQRVESADSTDARASLSLKSSFMFLGEKLLHEMSRYCEELKAPMKALLDTVADDETLETKLKSLHAQLSEIDPQRVDFAQSSFKSLLANLPGVGTPAARWSAKSREIDSQIRSILDELAAERALLERNSTALRDDQRRMRELGFKLKDYIMLAQLVNAKLVLDRSVDNDNARSLVDDLRASLLERIGGLEQRLAFNQQSLLACELLIRNNRELIIGVDRALSVTVAALDLSASLRTVLKSASDEDSAGISADELTGDAAAADGIEGKGKSSIERGIETLNQAFAQALLAVDEMSAFRRAVYNEMSLAMSEMNAVSGKIQNSLAAERADGYDSTNAIEIAAS